MIINVLNNLSVPYHSLFSIQGKEYLSGLEMRSKAIILLHDGRISPHTGQAIPVMTVSEFEHAPQIHSKVGVIHVQHSR